MLSAVRSVRTPKPLNASLVVFFPAMPCICFQSPCRSAHGLQLFVLLRPLCVVVIRGATLSPLWSGRWRHSCQLVVSNVLVDVLVICLSLCPRLSGSEDRDQDALVSFSANLAAIAGIGDCNQDQWPSVLRLPPPPGLDQRSWHSSFGACAAF